MDYEFPNGLKVRTLPVPPATLGLVTASETDLLKYDLPKRTEQNSEIYRRWGTKLRQGYSVIEPTFRPMKREHHHSRAGWRI
jgi:hypothetical protein